MDTTRFDALAKRIGAASTRRGVLLLLGALGTGGLGLADPDTAAGKCKEKCGTCKRCKKGKCRRKRTGASCPGGKCLSNRSCGIPCTTDDECPVGCLCAKNTEGQRFCHQSNTLCSVHDTCSRTKDCPRGEQCQTCNGADHCLVLCPIE
jgi:hypothetical protein